MQAAYEENSSVKFFVAVAIEADEGGACRGPTLQKIAVRARALWVRVVRT